MGQDREWHLQEQMGTGAIPAGTIQEWAQRCGNSTMKAFPCKTLICCH